MAAYVDGTCGSSWADATTWAPTMSTTTVSSDDYGTTATPWGSHSLFPLLVDAFRDPVPASEKDEEEVKQPNIHEFLRQLPKYSFKHPRVDAPMMTRCADRQRSMAASLSKPILIADNNNKHKEFFNRNAMVRVFCKN